MRAGAPNLTQPEAARISSQTGVQTLNLTLQVAATVQKVIVRENAAPLSADSKSIHSLQAVRDLHCLVFRMAGAQHSVHHVLFPSRVKLLCSSAGVVLGVTRSVDLYFMVALCVGGGTPHERGGKETSAKPNIPLLC